ncbi:MAG: type III-A CRISPR-associated protein Csm2 [Prevotellaceae bacterium]|jgi:CRISPR-associated protein Csm2|nr:type III-A CRISPR-associated protein Csm2 [Prevotellaceae bacterium]
MHEQNSNRPRGAQGGAQRPPQQNKLFNEYYDEVKNSYFRNFPDILDMGKTDNLDSLLSAVENFVKGAGVKVSTSQLRNVYDCVIKAHSVNEMKLIRPKLAYIAGRGQYTDKQFFGFIDGLIKTIKNDDQRKNFKVFFESVVAYHKFYGKNN